MQRVGRRHVPGWFGVASAVGALISVSMLSGCPGTLDPSAFPPPSTGSGGSGMATGGSSATGGNSATGGSTGSGGATGTGGTTPLTCTGNNDGATIISGTCAQQFCHDSSGAADCGGLDLTNDSGLASRLIGVQSMGSPSTNGSLCAGTTTNPYLVANSNPATGLLIDKIQTKVACGDPMPLAGTLTNMQRKCLVQWATTLTSP